MVRFQRCGRQFSRIMLEACATMPIENCPETKMANLAEFQNFIFKIISLIPIWHNKIILVQKNFQCATLVILLFNSTILKLQGKVLDLTSACWSSMFKEAIARKKQNFMKTFRKRGGGSTGLHIPYSLQKYMYSEIRSNF